jgi:hypothetical protein
MPEAILGSDRSAIDSTLRTKPALSRQPHTISSMPTENINTLDIFVRVIGTAKN